MLPPCSSSKNSFTVTSGGSIETSTLNSIPFRMIKAIDWAFDTPIESSSMKFVLVALADNADANGHAWPCTETLCRKTSLDRKTVILSIDRLEQSGLISDTGQRTGRTGQVKVYKLNCILDKAPKNGTVPFFPSKAPVFPIKGSQISVERLPKTGDRTVREPCTEPSGTVIEPSSGAAGLMEGEVHIAWESAEKWLEDARKNGADYTRNEAKSAWLALDAGGWMWGRRPVADWRSALERQIQTDRIRQKPSDFKKPNSNAVSPEQIDRLTRRIKNL